MKKLVMSVLVLAISGAMLAQNKKGNVIVGTSIGSGSIGHSESESGYSVISTISKSKSNTFSISLNPSVGKYITDNVVIGVEPGIGFYSSKYVSSNTANSNISTSKTNYFYASLGAYGRFYLGKTGGKGMPFIQAG